jgi:hypothetical protein
MQIRMGLIVARVTRRYPSVGARLDKVVRMRAEADGEVMVMEVDDDAAPQEVYGGDTRKMAAVQMVDLIEQSYGHEAAKKFAGGTFAGGTPMEGLPQLLDEVPASADAPMPEAPAPEVKAPSRLKDVALGGMIAMVAMIAWYCATQL